MSWSKESKPKQYLLSITKGYESDWEFIEAKALEKGVTIAELIRTIIRKQVEEWRHNHDSE